MKNAFKDLVATLKDLHWPSKKQVTLDTLFVTITATILSLMIFGWNSCIEWVVNTVLIWIG